MIIWKQRLYTEYSTEGFGHVPASVEVGRYLQGQLSARAHRTFRQYTRAPRVGALTSRYLCT